MSQQCPQPVEGNEEVPRAFKTALKEAMWMGRHTRHLDWDPKGLAKHHSLEKGAVGRTEASKGVEQGTLGEKCSLPAGLPQAGVLLPWCGRGLPHLGMTGGVGTESQTRASLDVLASPLALLPCTVPGHLLTCPPKHKGGTPGPCPSLLPL